MGGHGSGRLRGKPTENQFVRLSITSMRKFGMINDGSVCSGVLSWHINKLYTVEIACRLNMEDLENAALCLFPPDDITRKEHVISLQYTTPNYGGKRWWFECPSSTCGKRVGVLYHQRWPACRECWGMAYISQSKSMPDRCLDRAFKLADEIELSGNFIEGFKGCKPKGMHWATYYNKIATIERLAGAGLKGHLQEFRRKHPPFLIE